MRFCIALLLVESSYFLFIFFALSACSFTKFSGYPLSLNLFVMISQFLLNSEVVEHILFMRKAWLYGILSLRDLGWFDCACKYVCWSNGLRNIIVWILCCWSLYSIVSRNYICLVDILWSNFIVLCFLLSSSMNNISSSVVRFQIMKISSVHLRNSRALPWMYWYICFASNYVR